MGGVIDLTCREAQTGWFSEQKGIRQTCGDPQAEAGTAASREAGVELGGSFPEFGSWLGLHCWVTLVNYITSLSLPFPVCTLVVQLLTSQEGRGS